MIDFLVILFLLTYIFFDMKIFGHKDIIFLRSSVVKSVIVYILTVKVAHFIPFFEMYKSAHVVPIHMLIPFALLFLCVTVVFCYSEKVFKKFFILKPKVTPYKISFKLLILLGVSFSSFVFFFASWFRDYFGNLSPEQFLFNLQSPITGTADGMTMQIVFNPMFNTALVILIVGGLLFSNQQLYCLKSNKVLCFSKKRYGLGLTLFMLIGSLVSTFYLLKLDEVLLMYYTSSNYIENNYVDIRKVKTTFPNQKRNLIHIYFESVETSYFDKVNGGYMHDNLMPELLELTKEGISFSHQEKYGGPHQTHGSSWSVAGFVNMMSGIPLKVATDGNSYGLDGYFLPGLYNLGDFLHDSGYEQTIMFGSEAAFGGLDVYFTQHGQFNIFDFKHAKKIGLLPQDYRVWWGFEDDKLYDYAKAELTRLSQTGKPFNFMLENADTHFPNGYMTENTPKKYDSQYANVIAHSSKELVKLIRWIQEQPWYDNTTIVITGDHLSMDKEFFKDFNPNYHRTIFNVLLNSAVTTQHTKHRQFSPVDFYPTIVASLGIEIEGNRLGLGTNLFSNEKTLIERDTLQQFNKELRAKSLFYNSQFLSTDGYEKIMIPE